MDWRVPTVMEALMHSLARPLATDRSERDMRGRRGWNATEAVTSAPP
jgi:hypothetical protein